MQRSRPKTVPHGKKGDELIPPASPEELEDLAAAESDRPRKRGDCEPLGPGGQRPCPWVRCKHHLYLDVHPDTGTIRLTFPGLEMDQLEETCSLDVAERDGVTLLQVGELISLTRERVRQLEVRGLLILRGLDLTYAFGDGNDQ